MRLMITSQLADRQDTARPFRRSDYPACVFLVGLNAFRFAYILHQHLCRKIVAAGQSGLGEITASNEVGTGAS